MNLYQIANTRGQFGYISSPKKANFYLYYHITFVRLFLDTLYLSFLKIRILFSIHIRPKFIIRGNTVSEWIRVLIFKESLHIHEIQR